MIHKSTQGVSGVDPTYTAHHTAAQAAGLLWGAYHFGTGSDGVHQAENFLKLVGNPDNILLALDFESNPTGPSMSLEEARAFVTHVKEATGRYPGFYSGHDIKQALGTNSGPVLSKVLVLASAVRADGFCRDKPVRVPCGDVDDGMMAMIEALRKVIKRLHYPIEVMLVCVRWYAAYPLSLRHIEEMMEERGVFVDHATVHRWAIKILPVLAAVFRRHKRQTGSSWRMDETYILVGGHWKYLYRAVDRAGETVDFLLTAKRNCAAARRFLERAIDLNGVPEKITIDKSGANTAAIEGVQADSGADIELRRIKYLNNIVEQDHRAIKRIVRPMMGFKSFWSAACIVAGIETMHMIRKGQLDRPDGQSASAAEQFYSLAF